MELSEHSAPGKAKRFDRSQRKAQLDAVGHMAAGIANELRAPVLGISSAAQLLRFRAAEDPVIEKNVGRILREADRLNRMIAGLLEFGRVEPLRLAPADPDDVWDKVLERHRGTLESRSILVERVRAAEPVRCAIDVEQLGVAFGHLLENAIEASPEAGDLTLSSTTGSHGWSSRLRNGGDIIAAQTLPQVFEMFFTTRPGSAGIGLAIARRIVEEHDGAIEIASVAEAGTTVAITLPAAT
jgi:signal transduction histidine kinase